MDSITNTLFSIKDEQYKIFMAKLLPTVDESRLIGVRVPLIRKLARNMNNTDKDSLLNSLPHRFYEEDMLHAFLIAEIKDYSLCVQHINKFLPHVYNWGVCDSLRPQCLKNSKNLLVEDIKRWLKSTHPYTVRFAIEMLMVHFLDGDFRIEYLDWVSKTDIEEYYVKMMVAWYFATALAKQYDSALPYVEKHRLPLWTHKKAIQKAVESHRLTKEQKEYLRKYDRT